MKKEMSIRSCRLAKDCLKMLADPWTDPGTVTGRVCPAIASISFRAVCRGTLGARLKEMVADAMPSRWLTVRGPVLSAILQMEEKGTIWLEALRNQICRRLSGLR